MAVERGTDATTYRWRGRAGTGNRPVRSAARELRARRLARRARRVRGASLAAASQSAPARRPRGAWRTLRRATQPPAHGGVLRGDQRGSPRTTGRRATAGPPPGATARPAPSDASGTSIASTRSSSTLQPEATMPSPSASTAWWWCDLVACSVSPHARAANDPGASRTSWSALSNEPSARRWSVWPTSSGRCWISVPPRATFISCIPRQIPSTGRSRSSARSEQGDLGAVAVGARVGGLRVARRRRRARVDVGAAGQHQPVEAVEHVVRVVGDPRVGRQHQRDRARALQGVDVRPREQERLAVPDRPARALERGAEPDPWSACQSAIDLPYPASQVEHT